ncbi:MAG: hypothetical protein HC892_09765 [Saprospiraceae bacterium]|nr:hypothetical protein [Saprospiraceae bacterium]
MFNFYSNRTVKLVSLLAISVAGLLAYQQNYARVMEMVFSNFNWTSNSTEASAFMALTVNVFQDYDNDGTDDGAGEPGVAGLTLTAYDAEVEDYW